MSVFSYQPVPVSVSFSNMLPQYEIYVNKTLLCEKRGLACRQSLVEYVYAVLTPEEVKPHGSPDDANGKKRGQYKQQNDNRQDLTEGFSFNGNAGIQRVQ
jgi:hypothetical protein